LIYKASIDDDPLNKKEDGFIDTKRDVSTVQEGEYGIGPFFFFFFLIWRPTKDASETVPQGSKQQGDHGSKMHPNTIT
jgi:hypothetical protein